MSSWPHENLRNLERVRTLLPERASAAEIKGHLATAERYLKDAVNKDNSLSTRYMVAYAASHAIALAALRANDYRTAHERGHRRNVFEALPFTCGASKSDSLALVHAHERRNDIDYAGESAVSERETADLIGVADRIRKRLAVWLAENRPDLLK